MYTPEEMEIFEYHNGEKEVKADPVLIRHKLYRAVREQGFTLDVLLRNIVLQGETEQDLVFEAAEVLIPAIHQAFGTHDYDSETNTGLTWSRCMKLLDDFLMFEQKKRESIVATQPSSPVAASPQAASVPTAQPGSPMMPSMGSNSMTNIPTGSTRFPSRRRSGPHSANPQTP
jgi:hypothetical protein